MELTQEQNEELMQFETVQTKENKDTVGQINFAQVSLADLGTKKTNTEGYQFLDIGSLPLNSSGNRY